MIGFCMSLKIVANSKAVIIYLAISKSHLPNSRFTVQRYELILNVPNILHEYFVTKPPPAPLMRATRVAALVGKGVCYPQSAGLALRASQMLILTADGLHVRLNGGTFSFNARSAQRTSFFYLHHCYQKSSSRPSWRWESLIRDLLRMTSSSPQCPQDRDRL